MFALVLCIFFGGKKTFINIDTGQGKGKRGGRRRSKCCIRGKTYFHDKCAAGSPQRGFSPLAKHFLQCFRRPSFFARPLFLRLVPCAESPFIKRELGGGRRQTLSLFPLRLQCTSLGCLVVGNEKWQTNEKNEKEPLRSFIEKEEFRSKGKKAIFKESLLSPCTPRKWIRTIRGKK